MFLTEEAPSEGAKVWGERREGGERKEREKREGERRIEKGSKMRGRGNSLVSTRDNNTL